MFVKGYKCFFTLDAKILNLALFLHSLSKAIGSLGNFRFRNGIWSKGTGLDNPKIMVVVAQLVVNLAQPAVGLLGWFS